MTFQPELICIIQNGEMVLWGRGIDYFLYVPSAERQGIRSVHSSRFKSGPTSCFLDSFSAHWGLFVGGAGFLAGFSLRFVGSLLNLNYLLRDLPVSKIMASGTKPLS